MGLFDYAYSSKHIDTAIVHDIKTAIHNKASSIYNLALSSAEVYNFSRSRRRKFKAIPYFLAPDDFETCQFKEEGLIMKEGSSGSAARPIYERECYMKRDGVKRYATFLMAGLLLCQIAVGQSRDDFNEDTIAHDPRAITGWAFFAGDGLATMDFVPQDGYASIRVDSTKDKRNIWWALIKRCVSADMDLARLRKPGCELRIEARIRRSDAPWRVNLHLNTQRTTDFHSHLMEFDISDTTSWHTISMTTRDFDAGPGDTVFGQFALMD